MIFEMYLENVETQVATDQKGKQENTMLIISFYKERNPAPCVPCDSSCKFMAVREGCISSQLIRVFGSCGSTNNKLSFQSGTSFKVLPKFLDTSE